MDSSVFVGSGHTVDGGGGGIGVLVSLITGCGGTDKIFAISPG